MNRREFIGNVGKGAAVIALAGASLEIAGCNLGQDIVNWVPVAQNALTSIEKILTANNIIISAGVTAAFSAASAALTALGAAAKEYISASPAPVGTLAKLKLALQVVTDNINTFLTALNIPGGGILGVIIGLAGIVLSTIAGFTNQLPAGGGTVTVMASARINGNLVPVLPHARTRRAFKHDFNAVLESGRKAGVNCPADAYLHVSLLEKL